MMRLTLVGYAVFCMVVAVGRWPLDQRLAIGLFVWLPVEYERQRTWQDPRDPGAPKAGRDAARVSHLGGRPPLQPRAPVPAGRAGRGPFRHLRRE
jgi:hypothetical protein